MNLSNIPEELMLKCISTSVSITEALNKLLYHWLKDSDKELPRYFYLDIQGIPVVTELMLDEDGEIYIGDSETRLFSMVVIENEDHLKELNDLVIRVTKASNGDTDVIESVKLIKDTLRLKHHGVYSQIKEITVDRKNSKFTVVIESDISLTHWVHPDKNFNAQALKVILDWIKG